MMAMEELRALLDARGVEWWPEKYYKDECTVWHANGMEWRASEQTDGKLLIGCTSLAHLTPKQAVEATLGREPDDAAMVKLHDQMNAALLEYERAQGIERRDGDGRTVIPFVAEMHRLLEEAALRGHEECRMDKICDGYLYFTSYWCRECDGRFAYRLIGDKHATPKCCPICGAKVRKQ